MNFLKLINCSFGYKDKENLLNEISFELNKGDILAVMGCNGVGKTTLLNVYVVFMIGIKVYASLVENRVIR